MIEDIKKCEMLYILKLQLSILENTDRLPAVNWRTSLTHTSPVFSSEALALLPFYYHAEMVYVTVPLCTLNIIFTIAYY